jgi:hypothetical protein
MEIARGAKVLTQYKLPLRLKHDIDRQETWVLNGRNILSGWAFADLPLQLAVFAQGKKVAEQEVKRSRADVAAVFPQAAHARHSGFDFVLPVQSLPRGEYPLQLHFTQAGGSTQVVAGPLVRNDTPVFEYDSEHLWWPAERHDVSVWVAHEDKIAAVEQWLGKDKLASLVHTKSQQSYQPPVRDVTPKRDLQPSILQVGEVFQAKQVAFELNSHVPMRSVFRVTMRDGRTFELPGPLLLPKITQAKSACPQALRTVYWAIDGGMISRNDAVNYLARPLKSLDLACVKMGLRVRVEYLRHTLGRAQDFAFDADFKARSGFEPKQQHVYASLNESLSLAKRLQAPLMLTLDGGVWADAVFPLPGWDVVDELENEVSAVQWNQQGKAEADDAIKGLSGSYAEPQLARMMSLNVYNEAFRRYKKRNLQAAVKTILQRMAEHPSASVRISLDPDNTINPWFKDTQWYDYNPSTLRQFREWLTHTGAYASSGVLKGLGANPALNLVEINHLAKKQWAQLSEVDAPRGALDAADPWYQQWVVFKRHLVAQHVADLTAWAVEAGFPLKDLVSSLGVNDNSIALQLDDPIRGWSDQAGISVAGAVGSQTHKATIGLLAYGRPLGNGTPLVAGGRLFEQIAKHSPGWGLAEFNPASLDLPHQLPSYGEAKAVMQEALKQGARFFSPIPGSKASDQTLFPHHFKAYDAFDGTAFETALYQALYDWNHAALRPRKLR